MPYAVGQTTDAAIAAIDSLIQLNRSLVGQQRFDEALLAITAAEEKAAQTLGKDHALSASCHFNHGRTFFASGDYSAAESQYQEALRIREKTLGKMHADYAYCLNNLGLVYMYQGIFEKAEALLLEAKNIREAVLGKPHADYAQSLNNLALLYNDMGQYDQVEKLHIESKDIREKAVGKEHADYAASVHNLANFYFSIGKHEKAASLLEEAKSIRGRVLGKENSDYAGTLESLGLVYEELEQYDKAEDMFLKVKGIRERNLPESHPNNISGLNNLAAFYATVGRYKQAEALYLKAKDLFAINYGKEEIYYADICGNLANLYYKLHDFHQSEAFDLEALELRKKLLPPGHPDYAMNVENLANLYSSAGLHRNAEPLLRESLALLEKIFGKKSERYAICQSNLAAALVDLGQFRSADSLYRLALATLEKIKGPEHDNVTTVMANQATLDWKQERYESAGTRLMHVCYLKKKHLVQTCNYLTEQEMADYSRSVNQYFRVTLSLMNQVGGQSAPLAGLIFDNTLFNKGFALHAALHVRNRNRSNPVAAEKYEALHAVRRSLAAEYGKAAPNPGRVAELEQQANALEKDLTRMVAAYGSALRQVNWKDVQERLRPGQAVVEFVDFRWLNPHPTDSVLYAALMIQPGWEAPRWFYLCEQRQLEPLFSSNTPLSGLLAAAAVPPTRGAEPVARQVPTKPVFDLIWQPLETALAGAQTVYFAASGLLHRLNFDAIPTNDGRILSDKYALVRLGSSRTLVVPATVQPDLANRALLYGGIRYEPAAIAEGQMPKTAVGQGTVHEPGGAFALPDEAILQKKQPWNFLQGTETEVADINKLLEKNKFDSKVLSGSQATEESFHALVAENASPRILHLATHGFFFPDPKTTSARFETSPTFEISDHPMIRSGLILAGGNHAWATGKPLREGMEDGILTAYEISQMNLSNTELVVLSACETGLGDISGNEGVYGLQRAFKIAGAKYLIMSLWQVPDQETSVFMTAFYRHWLEGKKSIPDAFRATQRDLRERFVNPYQWAGFVLVE